MPFTAAHTIVAVPFAHSRRFPAVAVAAGAIAPDLPLYLTGGAGYDETHTLLAVPTIDLLLGLAVIAVWRIVLRPGVAVIVPMRAPVRLRLLLLPVPTAFGALTHVVWDAFSHAGRFGSALVPAMDTWIGPFPLTAWVQYGSSVGGVLVLGVAGFVALRRALRRADPSRWSVTVAVLVVAVAVAASVVAGTVTRATGEDLRAETSSVLTSGCLAAALALAAVGLVARLAARRQRSRAAGAQAAS